MKDSWRITTSARSAGVVTFRLASPNTRSAWRRSVPMRVGSRSQLNPYAYQLGAVWPHDNSIIALGFKRYGFAAEAARIARDISDAVSHFQGNQVPELYAGIQKDGTNFPCNILARTFRRHGQPVRPSLCFRPCWGFPKMRPMTGSISTLLCPPGLPISRFPTYQLARRHSRSGSGAKAR